MEALKLRAWIYWGLYKDNGRVNGSYYRKSVYWVNFGMSGIVGFRVRGLFSRRWNVEVASRISTMRGHQRIAEKPMPPHV